MYMRDIVTFVQNIEKIMSKSTTGGHKTIQENTKSDSEP